MEAPQGHVPKTMKNKPKCDERSIRNTTDIISIKFDTSIMIHIFTANVWQEAQDLNIIYQNKKYVHESYNTNISNDTTITLKLTDSISFDKIDTNNSTQYKSAKHPGQAQ